MKKAKKPKQELITLTPAKLKRIKKDVTNEACTKVNLIYLGVLAERGWTDDELVQVFLDVNRYTQYVEDKIVKLREIQEIIERNTGCEIKGKW